MRRSAKVHNETVQFSLGEFQRQIAARFPGHVAHKPDRQFESISVRQQVSDIIGISGSERRVATVCAQCPTVSARRTVREKPETLLLSSLGANSGHFLRGTLAKSGFTSRIIMVNFANAA
jgi:hypothetical protein